MLWKEICAATKITFNCQTLFCFINFGIDHGFSKQIALYTFCVKSLKQTVKKELTRFSHLLIHMHRLLIEKVDVVYFYKD